MRELTYVLPDDPFLKRKIVSAIEDVAGRRRYLPLYKQWQEYAKTSPQTMMAEMIRLLDVELEVHATSNWPLQIAKDEPVVLLANHPYGIADGIIALVLAEQLGRPYRVLINKDLLNVPEIKEQALPIDFSQTKKALEMNLKSRARARELLKQGVSIVVFPAGGVATAPNPLGRAEELVWGTFPARLIQQAKASVLPVYFEGQPGPLFHAVSRFSQSLRMMLMVIEFRNFSGKPFRAHVGDLTPFDAISGNGNRQSLTDELYLMVQRLAPHSKGKTDEELKPTPPDQRPNYPWETGGFY